MRLLFVASEESGELDVVEFESEEELVSKLDVKEEILEESRDGTEEVDEMPANREDSEDIEEELEAEVLERRGVVRETAEGWTGKE